MAHKILTWLLFAGALFTTLSAVSTMPGAVNSAGGAAAGLWIAFALLYLHDRKPQRP